MINQEPWLSEEFREELRREGYNVDILGPGTLEYEWNVRQKLGVPGYTLNLRDRPGVLDALRETQALHYPGNIEDILPGITESAVTGKPYVEPYPGYYEAQRTKVTETLGVVGLPAVPPPADIWIRITDWVQRNRVLVGGALLVGAALLWPRKRAK